MGVVNRVNNFIGSTAAKASEVNEDFDNLYNEFNGLIDENNLNFARAELQAAILTALKLVDGPGSGLNADLLDGNEMSDIQNLIDTAESDAKTYTDTHETETTGVHGVGASSVESVSGSQAKVDTHENKANPHSASVSDTDLTNHTNNGSAHHTRYADSEAISAINGDTNHGSTAQHDYLTAGAVTSSNWGDYEIQKDGADGSGIINFKTS